MVSIEFNKTFTDHKVHLQSGKESLFNKVFLTEINENFSEIRKKRKRPYVNNQLVYRANIQYTVVQYPWLHNYGLQLHADVDHYQLARAVAFLKYVPSFERYNLSFVTRRSL